MIRPNFIVNFNRLCYPLSVLVAPLPGQGEPIKAGEFILGYPGEVDLAYPMPQPGCLGVQPLQDSGALNWIGVNHQIEGLIPVQGTAAELKR